MSMRDQDGREKAERAAERVGEGVRNLRDDIGQSQMGQSMSEGYEQARQAMGETVEQVRERGDELIETLSDYVATRPMTSLGIAAAIGYFMGRMGGSRHH